MVLPLLGNCRAGWRKHLLYQESGLLGGVARNTVKSYARDMFWCPDVSWFLAGCHMQFRLLTALTK